MAVTYKDQFVNINGGESIATRISCKRMYLVNPAGTAVNNAAINDSAAALLFNASVPASATVRIEGPFNLEAGIAAPASLKIVLVR